MSRRSPHPTSCAATASAHVGQGHRTRIPADHRTRSARPPPLITRRPLPCRALVEAAQHACRTGSPDLELYRSVRERAGAQRATLTAARKIARRCFHTLASTPDPA